LPVLGFSYYDIDMKNATIILSLLILGCSSGPAPKDTVFDFIDAVKSSDSLRVVRDLDIDRYIVNMMSEMSPEDSTKVLADYRGKTLQTLLGDGDVRSRWLQDLIVVNEEHKKDTLADVEVSFVDRNAGTQLYTKMQLYKTPNETWRIYYFK
jgi:hypothetical protein